AADAVKAPVYREPVQCNVVGVADKDCRLAACGCVSDGSSFLRVERQTIHTLDHDIFVASARDENGLGLPDLFVVLQYLQRCADRVESSVFTATDLQGHRVGGSGNSKNCQKQCELSAQKTRHISPFDCKCCDRNAHDNVEILSGRRALTHLAVDSVVDCVSGPCGPRENVRRPARRWVTNRLERHFPKSLICKVSATTGKMDRTAVRVGRSFARQRNLYRWLRLILNKPPPGKHS